MLIEVYLKDGMKLLFAYDEYISAKETFDYLGVEYEAYILEDKMFRITFYDYIDDEWSDIWCTEDEYESKLADVIEAEVEYTVVEFN